LQRVLTTVTLVGLLVATAAAFAITERLKLTKSAVYGTAVSGRLSTTCGCAHGHARIFFKLRHRDTITVTVLNSHKDAVALLAANTFPRGPLTLHWNGHTETGQRAPDGTYRVQIHLSNAHQTIELPNRIVIDSRPPEVLAAEPNREIFSPDGDHQSDFVRIAYTFSEQAHAILYLDGVRIYRAYRSPAKGHISWFGNGPDGVLKQGSYTIELGAVDLYGNVTPAEDRWRLHLQIRYIELANDKIVAKAGRRFTIGVSTDARRYTWELGKRHGAATSSVLRLRAPARHGRYTLTVTEHGHSSRAAVFVR
jgi:hypothetical protein